VRRLLTTLLRPEMIVLLAVAIVLAVVSTSTRPSRADLQLTSGPGDTLTLSNDKEGAAILSIGGMRPGDSVTDTVTLGNTGTVAGDLTVSTSNLLDTPGAGGGALSGELDLVITDETNAGSPVVVYSGKISALTPVSLGILAAGDSRLYQFQISFPDEGAGAENAYQGSGLSVEFDWTAVNNDADTDPPETTITAAPSALSANPNPSFSFTADEAGSTFECSLDGGSLASCGSPASLSGLGDGAHTFSVSATDASGNTDASPAIHAWTIDATGPNVSLADPGAYVRGTVTLNASANDGTGSGVASMVIQRSPAGAGSWTAVAASWDTASVADGSYDLRARATDNAGNAANSPVRTVTVDNKAPSVSSSVPADGTLVAAAGSLAVVANENVAGIANATVDGSPAPAPTVAGSLVTYATAFADGPHTLEGELEDLAGNRRPIALHFTVWSLAAADYPWIEKNSFASLAMTLPATNGDADISVPAGAWSGAPAGDWLVVRIDPRPQAALPGGFQTAGDIYDVSAYWALAGSAVDSFAKPLDLTVDGSAGKVVPATLVNGAWRTIAPVPSGQTLPSGWDDGYYKAGADVHILTRHLSTFGLLQDVKAPARPDSFSGSRSNGRLVLEWKAAKDNSGLIGAYLVYANGKIVKTLAGSARSADMGAYKTTDSRSFQVAARDAAGNVGAKTTPLVLIPALENLGLAQAKSRLTGRGLETGTLTYAYSPTVAAGRVISAARGGVVRKGTAIGLTISRGSGRTASSVPGTTGYGTPSPPFSSSGAPTGVTPTAGGIPGTPIPSPLASTPSAPSSPSADAEEVAEVQPESFVPAEADESGSSLRRLLGLALLAGAFLAAGGIAWGARRPKLNPAPQSSANLEPLLLWDQRLVHAVATTVRRLAGRA
jgi:hypothetical protein